jgi:hypothetical protein
LRSNASKDALPCCNAYVAARCASLEAKEYPEARIYPGPELECFRTIANGLVGGVPRDLERQYHTALDFKRRRPSSAAMARAVADRTGG